MTAPTLSPARLVAAGLLAAVLLAPAASAQVAFSIDWQGPTIGQPDPINGQPLTEADVLGPAPGAPTFGPLPPPRVLLSGDALDLSLYTACSGHPPGTPCGIEVNALSHGEDARLTPAGTPLPNQPPAERVWFSVDEYAKGDGVPTPGHAEVRTEAPVGDACADVFVDVGLPGGPVAPGTVVPHSAGTMDGNGLASATGFAYFGLGLVEPNPPTTTLPNPGDNLDALDIGFPTGFPAGGVYMSLDAAFPDPLSGLPSSGTAAIEGVSGAAVLRVPAPGAAKVVFAPAVLLGLDLSGTDTDDIDALILAENGDGIFQPSQTPFDWLSAGGPPPTDMLLFSVRRGSAVVGQMDSIFGIPIEEGDVLTTPLPTSLGGLSPFPGIFIAAENLGLATVRSGTAQQYGDDVDALDTTEPPCFDCNNNGVEDSVDIATGASSDVNMNGVPDECEESASAGCTCPAPVAPCSNPDRNAGCANSSGAGGLLGWSGSTSVFSDDLVLSASQLPRNVFGIVFMGDTPALTPFGDGLRCAGGQTFRYGPKHSGAGGAFAVGPGLGAYSCATFPPGGCLTAGNTWIFQAWFRDPAGPCGSGYNLTNGLAVTFTP